MLYHVIPLLVIFSLSWSCGCRPADHDPRQMVAVHAPSPPCLDGRWNEALWQQAPSYPLGLSRDLTQQGKTLREGGWVKLAWDAEHLYLGIHFDDTAIIATGTEDHLMHFNLGDICEIFLGPEPLSYYWEMYVTPTGKKTCQFFSPPRKQGGKSTLVRDFALQTKTYIDPYGGGWDAEIALPAKQFARQNEPWGTGSGWRIFIARYNYSAPPPEGQPEISGALPLSQTDHHLINEYARLKLVN